MRIATSLTICETKRRLWFRHRFAQIEIARQLNLGVRNRRRGRPVNRYDYHHPDLLFRPQWFSEKEEHNGNNADQEKRCKRVRDDLTRQHPTSNESTRHSGTYNDGRSTTDDEGTHVRRQAFNE
ncbi:hypothetical protein NKJ90_15115 [Mesorhizobium sp. M0051]|uniref:hypothetical protein n=1 Tax=unclassified Mesorhizobium TaxID=325217 RepID=UPI0012EC5372|nr:hypothetical protein [Mesorhizobium sp. LNHC252B00]